MKFLIAILGLCFSSSLMAADAHFYFGAGLDFGGDTLLEVNYTNGGSEKLTAGGGAHFAVGTDVDIRQDVMMRGTVGYKVNNVTAENGDLSFTRVPIELTAYKFFGEHGIGGGVTYLTGGKLKCDISGICDFSASADNTNGMVVEYLYRSRREDSNKGFSIGVRGVFGVDYTFEGGTESVGGNSLGVNIGMTL
ncbi:MAG: hypothetical protein P1U67_07230 [Alcanivoracaceae bacterium]|nr:hypothetical protein [Alcanivoracaceae bacterium]